MHLTGIKLGLQRAHRARDPGSAEQAGRNRRGFIAPSGVAAEFGVIMLRYLAPLLSLFVVPAAYALRRRPRRTRS